MNSRLAPRRRHLGRSSRNKGLVSIVVVGLALLNFSAGCTAKKHTSRSTSQNDHDFCKIVASYIVEANSPTTSASARRAASLEIGSKAPATDDRVLSALGIVMQRANEAEDPSVFELAVESLAERCDHLFPDFAHLASPPSSG